MMNYFNNLCELATLTDTTHLSDKGSKQVEAFVSYVTPLIPDIKKGDAAKAAIASYYLEHKSGYTPGTKKMLEPLVNTLGVSSGYISQVKKAKEFVGSIQSKDISAWVSEHPITVQYRMAKLDHDQLHTKFKTGEHFSQREVESFTRVNQTKEEPVPVSAEVSTTYKDTQTKISDLIGDESKKWITNHGSASAYLSSGRSDLIRAALQVVSDIEDIGVMSPQMVQALLHLQKKIGDAVNANRYVSVS